MAFRAFACSFFDPNMVALTWSHSRYFIPDDGGVQLVPSHIKTLNSLEQIQQIGVAQSQFLQIELRYTVTHHTAVFKRESLSFEELERVLGCCDQWTNDPLQAIANTRACWEKMFPDVNEKEVCSLIEK